METRKIRILLVDDDSDYCLLVKMALQRSTLSVRFVVETAESLAQAEECLEHNNYDVALLDLGLPDSSGLETFDRIHRSSPKLPVVMLTGTKDEDMSVEAIRRGASDYLVKGVDSFTDILVRTILYTLERRHAEEALRLSETNFRNVINANADGIVVVDKERVVLFANPSAETLFGQGAEELLGKAFDYPVVPAETTEIRIARKGRKPVVAEMRVVEINWQGNDAYLVSLRDTTSRRAAERKQTNYRENLRALVKERSEELDAEKKLLLVTFSSMGDGVIVVDPEKRIMLFNRVAETLAGWELERVQDKNVDELFHVVDERTMRAVESPIDKVLRSGQTEVGTDFDVLVALDGSERPISTVAAPVRQNDGTIMGIVLVFRDVSREREIDRVKQNFFSSISHELRTPLTSIKAYTETILNDFEMTEQTRRQFLGIIDEESNRLADLIEELLEISRLESGIAKIVREPVDIVGVIKHVASALQPLAKKKNIQLEVEIDDGLPELAGDSSKIESVATNLINNAIKYTPERGRVRVSIRQRDEQLVMCVSDTGIGIPKEALPRIFDRFYRVGHQGTRIKGTGLGLAIVKKVVEIHGGRIEVESDVAQGTTFTVYLPFAADPAPELPHTANVSRKGDSTQIR